MVSLQCDVHAFGLANAVVYPDFTPDEFLSKSLYAFIGSIVTFIPEGMAGTIITDDVGPNPAQIPKSIQDKFNPIPKLDHTTLNLQLNTWCFLITNQYHFFLKPMKS